MKFNRIFGIFIGLLILIGLSASVYINYKLNSDLVDSHKEIDSLVEDNSVLNRDILECQDNVSGLEVAVEEANAAVEEANEAVEEANEEVDEAVEKYDRLKNSMVSMSSELGELRTELSKDEELLKCDVTLENISFSSNSTVSRNLQEWVSDRAGSVHDARWDVIWTGTRDSIHYIRVKEDSGFVMYVFITYLGDNSWKPESVFDVNNQCWLYLPE